MVRTLVLALTLLACGDRSGQKDAASTGGDGDAVGSDGSVSTVDAAIMPGPACGPTTCTSGTEECCLSATSVCKPAGTCPSQGFLCDGPEDCPGSICCYPNSNNGSRCQTNNCQDRACHNDGDCAGEKCCPKPFSPPGYGVCRAAC